MLGARNPYNSKVVRSVGDPRVARPGPEISVGELNDIRMDGRDRVVWPRYLEELSESGCYILSALHMNQVAAVFDFGDLELELRKFADYGVSKRVFPCSGNNVVIGAGAFYRENPDATNGVLES